MRYSGSLYQAQLKKESGDKGQEEIVDSQEPLEQFYKFIDFDLKTLMPNLISIATFIETTLFSSAIQKSPAVATFFLVSNTSHLP